MPSSAPAIWSAVAASFAALSSFLIMLIQRRNLLESVRPELVLTGWTHRPVRPGDAAHEVIAFQTIENIGRGAALHIYLHGPGLHTVANRPTAILSTIRVPILGANKLAEVNGQIIVWWNNVEPHDGEFKVLDIPISIGCWDSSGMRHETQYLLGVVPLSLPHVVTDAIAPGVMLVSRTTTTKSGWSLRLFSKLGRIPGLGRLFRKTAGAPKTCTTLFFPRPTSGESDKLSTRQAARAIGVTHGTLLGYIKADRLHPDPDGTISTTELLHAGFIIRH